MARTKQIKSRIKAVGNIRRITKTMQMIATARFQAAQRRALASRPYTTKIAELVGEVAAASGAGGQVTHPLLRTEPKAGGKRLVLALTSNRGLCGGYNASVLRAAMAHLREHQSAGVELELVGKKGAAFFRFNKVALAAFHTQFTDKPAFEQVRELADRYMALFADGKVDAVDVAFMSFQSVARQSAQVLNLLPLRPPTGADAPQAKPQAATEYDFSPAPDVLLGELLPVTVKTRLFQCFNEAVVSEQIARMVAMKSATDAAGKMGKMLTRKYNRARQAAITTELTEVISGSAALE